MIFIAVFSCVFNANAAIKVKNDTANKFAGQSGSEIANFDEDEAIATLENDIRILDEEIAKCEKQKKGWIAATVIGSAGVVSTGVAAAVQGVKIKDQKEELSDKKSQLKSLNQQKSALDNQ